MKRRLTVYASAALVTLFVLRGVVQATAINRFLTDSWPAVGCGELVLAAAHPTFMSLTSLAVALVAIAILALLYRPDVNDYFRAHSPTTTGQRDRDFLEPALSQTGTEAPLTMSNPAQHRATGPTERTDTTATQSTALPSTTPSREEPIAPAI